MQTVSSCLGLFFDIGSNAFAISEILDVINGFHVAHGGPGKFWLGNRLFVYVDDPKHFEIILNAPASLDKGDSYNFIVESIGYGLITLKCKCNAKFNSKQYFYLFI